MEPLFADAKVSTNSCGTPGRPSFLAPNVVSIWVPELGSELWFAAGHVCVRKVLLNVSLGVVAAPELLGTEQTPYEGGPKKARATPAIPAEASVRQCLHGSACTEASARQRLHGSAYTQASAWQCLH